MLAPRPIGRGVRPSGPLLDGRGQTACVVGPAVRRAIRPPASQAADACGEPLTLRRSIFPLLEPCAGIGRGLRILASEP